MPKLSARTAIMRLETMTRANQSYNTPGNRSALFMAIYALKRSADLEELRATAAKCVKDGECATCYKDGFEENPDCPSHEPFDMPNDDAVDTLHSLIEDARGIGPNG